LQTEGSDILESVETLVAEAQIQNYFMRYLTHREVFKRIGHMSHASVPIFKAALVRPNQQGDQRW
jgi:hypothetical protein